MKKIILTGTVLLSLINFKAQTTKKIDCNEGFHSHVSHIHANLSAFMNQIKWDIEHNFIGERQYDRYYLMINPLVEKIDMINHWFDATMKDSVNNKRVQPWVEWEQKDILCECATKLIEK